MLFLSTLVLALFGSAFAIPTSSLERRHPALAVVEALQGLEKRQTSSTSEALSSLQDLLNKLVSSSSSSNGQCSSECAGWVDAVTGCTEEGSYYQVGVCACGETPLSAMSTCGDCYGSSSADDASTFASFCRDAISSISSTASSRTSGVASASASGASRTSSAEITRTSAADTSSEETSTSTRASQGTAAPQASASQTPGSGAGTVKVGAGIVIGAAAGVVAMMMV